MSTTFPTDTELTSSVSDVYREVLRKDIEEIVLDVFATEALSFGPSEGASEPWVQVRRGWSTHRIDLGVRAFLAPNCSKTALLISLIEEHAAHRAA
jgi:hypothetical protein